MKLGACVRQVSCDELLEGLPRLQYIAAGGMSMVYAGVWSGNVVAVKFVCSSQLEPSSPAYRELFFCGHLRHPNVVQTFECRITKLTAEFISSHKLDSASGELTVSPAGADSMLAPRRPQDTQELKTCDSFEWQPNQLPSVATQNQLQTMQDVLDRLQAKPGQHLAVIIMDYCDRGTLAYWAHRGLFTYREGGVWPWRYVYRALLRTAAEVAQALLFMHAKDMVHSDLKPLNVLVKVSAEDKRGFTAAVTDFGLAKVQVGNCCPHTQHWATLHYMAPETFDGLFCKGSDVFSFGIMLHEMYTARAPYQGMTPAQIFNGVKNGDLRPVWSLESPPELRDLATRCWHKRPEMRPTFEEVLSELLSMERELRSWFLQAKQIVASHSDASRSNSMNRVAVTTGTSAGAAACADTPGSCRDVGVASQRGMPSETTPRQHRPGSHPANVDAPQQSSSLHRHPSQGGRSSLDEGMEAAPSEPLIPPRSEEEEVRWAAAINGAADVVLRGWQLQLHRWRPDAGVASGANCPPYSPALDVDALRALVCKSPCPAAPVIHGQQKQAVQRVVQAIWGQAGPVGNGSVVAQQQQQQQVQDPSMVVHGGARVLHKVMNVGPYEVLTFGSRDVS